VRQLEGDRARDEAHRVRPIQSSVPALGDGSQLLPAFDGKLLLQVLGIGDDALATYTVAPDLVTVTPNTHAPVDPRPTSGVLMPCPAL
jgi:hypothetical protein